LTAGEDVSIIRKISKYQKGFLIVQYDPAKIFKALSNESRLEILKSLYLEGISGTLEGQAACAECCSCVGDIVERFRLAPSTISHHIKELAMAGLVKVERNGQFIKVLPNPEALEAISAFSESLVRGIAEEQAEGA
jgi:ArsR family transcriptional regulator